MSGCEKCWGQEYPGCENCDPAGFAFKRDVKIIGDCLDNMHRQNTILRNKLESIHNLLHSKYSLSDKAEFFQDIEKIINTETAEGN